MAAEDKTRTDLEETQEAKVPLPAPSLPPACLEHSTGSKGAWVQSLNKGCLNKGLSEKLRLYSYLPELARLDLGLRSNLEPTQRDVSQSPEAGSSDNLASPSEDLEETGPSPANLPSCAPSPVIAYDLLQPPPVGHTSRQLLVSHHEFFSFLRSDDWREESCLTVVGGELLALLLSALCQLERRGRIHRHEARAFLNNQRTGDETQPGDLSNEDANLTSTTNETLSVQMFYYDKVIPVTAPKKKQWEGVISLPLAHRFFDVNNIRLPPYENVDPVTKIAEVAEEVQRLRDLSKLQEKEKPEEKGKGAVKGKGQDKGKEPIEAKAEIQAASAKENKKEKGKAVDPGDVEYIAEDPYFLQLEKVVEPAEKTETEVLSTDVTPAVPKDSALSRDQMTKDGSSFIESSYSLTLPSLPEEEEEEEEEHRESFEESEVETFATDSRDKANYKMLNLSGNDLYVTSLYRGKDANAVNTAEKLSRLNSVRRDERAAQARKVMKEAIKNSPVDLKQRFKRLQWKHELARRKAAAPRVEPKAKPVAGTSHLEVIDEWERYHRAREEVEMHAATENKLERRVLDRLEKEIARVKDRKDLDVTFATVDQGKSREKTKKRDKNASNRNRNFSAKPFVRKKKQDENARKALPALKKPPINNSRGGVPRSVVTRTPILKKENDKAKISNSVVPSLAHPLQMRNAKVVGYFNGYRPLGAINRNRNSPFNNNATDTEAQLRLSNAPKLRNSSAGDVTAGSKTSSGEISDDDPEGEGESVFFEETASQLLAQELAQYNYDCTCWECTAFEHMFAPLRPDLLNSSSTYAIHLNRLRDDFAFLKHKHHTPLSTTSSPLSVKSHFRGIVLSDVMSELLDAMDEFVVRKEILSSDLGKTYTTVTFSKRSLYTNTMHSTEGWHVDDHRDSGAVSVGDNIEIKFVTLFVGRLGKFKTE